MDAINGSHIGDLPKEMVREILLRLPVKALLQSKCVCKGWCDIIGNKSFIDSHCSHESNQDCLLFQLMSYPVGRLELAVYPDDGRHLSIIESDYLPPMLTNVRYLLGPAHGIFCVVSQPVRVDLFNPATRKFKLLPPIPLLKPRGLEFGFGFDPFSGDFKVVAFWENFICVYHSSSDSWRETRDVEGWLSERIHTASCNEHGIFLNGVYHWLLDGGIDCRSVLAFDMRSEDFQEIIVPEAIRCAETLLMVDITTYGDSVALLSHEEEVERCINLWVMGRDRLWVKYFSIDIPQLEIYSLCVWNKNELLLQTLETETDTQKGQTSVLLKCDISTRKLLKFGPEFDHLIVSGLFSYKESLVSIEGESDTVVTNQMCFVEEAFVKEKEKEKEKKKYAHGVF